MQGIHTAQAADEVILRGGVYYQGEIALPRSGTPSMPIIIRGYTGEEAVIDGGDPNPFVWLSAGGGVYSAVVNAADTHLVTVGGKRLFPYQSLPDLQDLKWGIPGFFSNGTDLYVHLEGDIDPNTATITVSRLNYAFYVEQDHIRFEGLTFRHFGRGSYAKAIYLNNANDNWVSGCTFAINDLGVGLKRASHRNVIQDCEFYDTIFEWPWDASKTESGLEGGAIRFYDPVTGKGNIVRRNVFQDYFDGFGVCPASTFDCTNETDVYHNLVYRAGDDGMETNGQASNVRIWENIFHDVLMGISLAPVYTGPVYVLRNHIYRTGAGNSTYSGSPCKFNSGYDTSGTMYLFHNTCDAVLAGNNGIYIKAPGTWENIVVRNNIWSGTLYALNNYNETQPVDFDYDDLYTTDHDEFVYWGSGPDRHMHDLLTFQTLTGQELHGLNVVPGFADPDSGDYRLDPESKLIDAGVVLAGINDDYFGAAPDIGAFEFACSADADGDGDVDGKDLAVFAAAYSEDCLKGFTEAFGKDSISP